jgi:hypothetical protein
MSRLGEALARLERAVTRLEAVCVSAGSKEAAPRPGGRGVDAASSRLERGARVDAAASTLAGKAIGGEGRGVE